MNVIIPNSIPQVDLDIKLQGGLQIWDGWLNSLFFSSTEFHLSAVDFMKQHKSAAAFNFPTLVMIYFKKLILQ